MLFPHCVSQTKHFCTPQRGSKTAQGWGVWDLLLSVPRIKTIQAVNTILWATTCWVSQSLSKLLFHNKLWKTLDCFEVCGWTARCRGCLFTAVSHQNLYDKERRSHWDFLAQRGKFPVSWKWSLCPVTGIYRHSFQSIAVGFFSPVYPLLRCSLSFGRYHRFFLQPLSFLCSKRGLQNIFVPDKDPTEGVFPTLGASLPRFCLQTAAQSSATSGC